MRGYVLHRPDSIAEASRILREQAPGAQVLAGGTDLVAGIMRDSVTGKGMPYPEHLVDLATVESLGGVDFGPDTVTIGAMTTLADLAESAQLRRRLPLLADAAESVASPEIRAVGTVGGNLNQRPRCWFFRMKDFDCLKKGGDICYAVDGDNRYNAILGGHLCFIVHPSDVATALLALDARAVVASAEGRRTLRFDEYFVSPRDNLLFETALRPGEILAEVQVPYPAAGTGQAWVKINEKGRPTWDFAVVSAAATVEAPGGVWQRGRIVLGGVAPVPYRAEVVEAALAGREVAAEVEDAARRIRSVARPMRDNAYKIGLAEVSIERAVRAALERAGTEQARGRG